METINNRDVPGNKKMRVKTNKQNQSITKMFEKMIEHNNKNEKINNELQTRTTRCKENTTTTTEKRQDVKQEDEQQNKDETQ